MPQAALKLQNESTCPITDDNRNESIRVRQSLRKTLSQSIDLKDLAFETAMRLKDLPNDDVSADRERSRAMAVASAIKAYKDMNDIIRIVRNKSLPPVLKAPMPTIGKPKPTLQFHQPSE